MGHRTRRSIAAGAAALFTASGIMAIAPSAVAQADTANCATSQTSSFRTGDRYHLTKEIMGNGTAAPGGEVTFRTTVTGVAYLVNRIDDFHPEGFELVSARHSVWHLFGGQQWSDVTDDVRRDAPTNSVFLTSGGWTTAGNAHVTLETTYRVPNGVSPGDVLNTGAGTTLSALSGRHVANPIDTCVTIREPNPVEQVTGSLDGLGLGSVTDGSTAAGGISSDPSGFSADIINGIDIGQMIGLS